MAGEQSATFTCQMCRARLTLVGNLEGAATEASSLASGSGRTHAAAGGAPPHLLQASVFDTANFDESFIVLDGRRQGAEGAVAHAGILGLLCGGTRVTAPTACVAGGGGRRLSLHYCARLYAHA